MIKSLGIIFVVTLIFVNIGNKLKIPSMISMIFSGILLGEQGLCLIDNSILSNSAEIRKIALIIILLRVGFSLKLDDFKSTGRQALGMAFLPATFEVIGVLILAPIFFEVNYVEALLLGAVLSAVSPAVVMPRMLDLIEKGYGTNKKIPQMILAGASLDDIYVLVLFATFLGLATGENLNFMSILNMPVSIIFGLVIGVATGFILYKTIFSEVRKNSIKYSIQIIWLLGIAFLLMTLEEVLSEFIAMSGLLAVVSMAMYLNRKISVEKKESVTAGIMDLWSGGELLLFTLVGASVNLEYVKSGGFTVAIFILIVLIVRCIGVFLALLGSELNTKEKIFCVVAYMPKATVQAAIGGVPLAMGIGVGELILTVAVMAILITAPIGAIGIDFLHNKLLVKGIKE